MTSPCADASGRGGCHATQEGFTEIHGKLTAPIFQTSSAPYLQPEDGGGIELTNGSKPRAIRHEDVCFALSVPLQAAPATGHPLLIYAHAVGGVFQEAIRSAQRLVERRPGMGDIPGPICLTTSTDLDCPR